MTDSPAPASLLKFTPVPRKTVSHGWTPEKQRGFIDALAETGSVRVAAASVGMGYTGVYKLRTAPGSASFCRAWDQAALVGILQVRDVLIDHAVNGIPEPIHYAGKQVGERRRFNHRTMIWLLQHHMPDTYPGASPPPRGDWELRQEAVRLAGQPRRGKNAPKDSRLRDLLEAKLSEINRRLGGNG